MKVSKAYQSLFYVLTFLGLTLFSSCNKDEGDEIEADPDFVIVDDTRIILNLTWTVPDNENGFEEADLDLATTNLEDEDNMVINIVQSENTNSFESINVNTPNQDNTFRVRVRYHCPALGVTTGPEATYTLIISNNDSTVSRVFTNTITPPPTGSITTWISDEVQVPAIIWKNGNQFTFIE